MDFYSEIIAFARKHCDEDPLKLLLRQRCYPSVDLKLVAQQLEGQKQASAKWPTLARCADYFYPPRLNREQSSSEIAARYKAGLFRSLGGGILADLTGGMGVDSYFIAQEATCVDYFELDPALATVAERNFRVLGQNNITCRQGDGIALLQESGGHYDTILLDPARRDKNGGKVVAFEECTPNILCCLDLLLSRCKHLLIKASPMVDIHQALRQLPQTFQVHIVAIRNECKEVLFLLQSGSSTDAPSIHCLNFPSNSQEALDIFPKTKHFSYSQESSVTPTFATRIVGEDYIYEPNAALMKGGCFNLISLCYGLDKLSRNTHLYTSPCFLPDFPGRVFRVIEEVPLNAKKIASFFPNHKAHVISRNYPLTSEQLHNKLKLSEGGSLFLIAATLSSTPRIWLCQQCRGPLQSSE